MSLVGHRTYQSCVTSAGELSFDVINATVRAAIPLGSEPKSSGNYRDRVIFVSSSIVSVLRKVTKYPPEFIHLCGNDFSLQQGKYSYVLVTLSHLLALSFRYILCSK